MPIANVGIIHSREFLVSRPSDRRPPTPVTRLVAGCLVFRDRRRMNSGETGWGAPAVTLTLPCKYLCSLATKDMCKGQAFILNSFSRLPGSNSPDLGSFAIGGIVLLIVFAIIGTLLWYSCR